MDIQEKLKLKLQFFAEESDGDNGKSKDNNDDEGKDKQDKRLIQKKKLKKDYKKNITSVLKKN
ncbi:hypothetical protein [Staphylococcus aureus]|uniref:hypothetical protein n=1 Tax=Staphylococcus aureus TaxID=1280 RepID=UPI003A0FC75D